MMNCKDASRLLSESMDRPLSLWERFGLLIHVAMCKLCFGFSKDMQQLREAARRHAEEIELDSGTPDTALSEEARRRIKHALEGRNG